jgi:amidase
MGGSFSRWEKVAQQRRMRAARPTISSICRIVERAPLARHARKSNPVRVSHRSASWCMQDESCFRIWPNIMLNRRHFLRISALTGAAAITGCNRALPSGNDDPSRTPFELEEKTIAELQDMMKSGQLTARSITEKYLARIDSVDRKGPHLNSILETNPDALAIATALDEERKSKGPRGPLHGIPVLIKDNIDTADRMSTTAGSLALEGSVPQRDAFVIEKLRNAGAVILGKTNLSEWANFRSARSTSGWSGRGGLVRNPYALNRNPCGSSSGSGVAVSANLCSIAIGT